MCYLFLFPHTWHQSISVEITWTHLMYAQQQTGMVYYIIYFQITVYLLMASIVGIARFAKVANEIENRLGDAHILP